VAARLQEAALEPACVETIATETAYDKPREREHGELGFPVTFVLDAQAAFSNRSLRDHNRAFRH
jgi:hypothetical protein